MKQYLSLYLSLEEEKRNQLLERFKGIIEADGSISNVDEWGIRKLAYEIDDIRKDTM